MSLSSTLTLSPRCSWLPLRRYHWSRSLATQFATGLLTSLAHPGGNLTGVSINAGIEIYGKRLQIIQEAMPKVAKVAALFWVAESGRSEHQEAARKLGIELTSRELAEVNEVQIRRTFAEIAERQFDAVICVDKTASCASGPHGHS